jgi:cell division protein FtsW
MATLARTDTSLVGYWWWTIDRWNMGAVAILAMLGALLTLAASPAVAERLNLDTFYFARRQIVFLALGLSAMIAISFLSLRGVRRFSVVLMVVSVILMILTLFFGDEIKGASRWLRIGGISIQASEFVKPAFAILAAWMFSVSRLDDRIPGYSIATGMYFFVIGLLLLQPDVGMSIVISAIWGMQIFVAGLPLTFVIAVAAFFLAGSFCAYFVFDHVRGRVDRFLDPDVSVGFQVSRSIEAFRNGGWTGRGPGEGRVKEVLPDAHADFILAVAGEEFGLIVCMVIVALFLFVVLRGFTRIFKDDDFFVLLAVTGLLVQFAIQAIINMASTLNLMPPKGMTLPFISYGGSSTLALGLGMGMVLALTRIRSSQGSSHG